MTKLFTQNAKMRATSKTHNINLFNFGIPAFKSQSGMITCPNATKCVNGCYAKSGAYLWSNVAKAYEWRLSQTLDPFFVEQVRHELNRMVKNTKQKTLVIRVHDSGDFYSAIYFLKWMTIAREFPQVKFYAYTKMVSLVKSMNDFIPKNFTIIYSYGGSEDSLIDPKVDRHSYVFDGTDKLERNGYDDASHDDSVAWSSNNNKIGLVYHGAKNFSNTSWGRV